MPGLGELRELLDQARAAGLEVAYTLSGAPRELPEGAELAAYRVVQESLTNTRKHAGLAATAAVTLRYEPDGLVVEVTDDGLGGSGGRLRRPWPGRHAGADRHVRRHRDRRAAAGRRVRRDGQAAVPGRARACCRFGTRLAASTRSTIGH